MSDQDAHQTLKQGMEQKLAELGGTPAEVAASLQELGIAGHRRRSSDCPIAVYLRGIFGGRVTAGVSHCFLWIQRVADVKVTMTPAVKAFVEEFDKGVYPALITEP